MQEVTQLTKHPEGHINIPSLSQNLSHTDG
jgi:hypothetical protein